MEMVDETTDLDRYDRLYRLYERFDTESLREYQEFVDVFPPLDSRVGRDYWADAQEELAERRAEIRDAFDGDGETWAAVAARADREQAFTALDLLSAYGRGVNALVLDVDETLRSAGETDNEIPRETLYMLTRLVESGVPLVICTGQTLENVKGFAIQGLGNELVHSGDVSIVYEAGTGVFTPGHGPETKQLLYEGLDPAVNAVFEDLRSRALSDAPDEVRSGCHLQGNEFNVTLKPNFETGSEDAARVVDRAMVHLLELLGEAVADQVDAGGGDADPADGRAWARSYYAADDPELAAVLGAADGADADGPSGAGDGSDEPDGTDADESAGADRGSDGIEGRGTDVRIPDAARDLFERIDAAHYAADAAEIGSRELNKVGGVEAALEVLGIDDPFVLVMGDSKTDLRVMEWAAANDAGFAAAPEHASETLLRHVREREGLVFAPGDAASPLRVVYALNSLAE